MLFVEMYRYTTSDEEEEEEDEDDEGGLASIFQGLIKTQTPDLGIFHHLSFLLSFFVSF